MFRAGDPGLAQPIPGRREAIWPDKLAKGDMPDGTNITKVIVNGYVDGALITGAWYIGPAASGGKVVGGELVAEIANGTYQWFDLSQPSNEKKNWD